MQLTGRKERDNKSNKENQEPYFLKLISKAESNLNKKIMQEQKNQTLSGVVNDKHRNFGAMEPKKYFCFNF